jgi:hypothetical protein
MPDSVYACLREGFISAVDIGLLLPKTMVRGLTPGNSDGARRAAGQNGARSGWAVISPESRMSHFCDTQNCDIRNCDTGRRSEAKPLQGRVLG